MLSKLVVLVLISNLSRVPSPSTLPSVATSLTYSLQRHHASTQALFLRSA